MLRLLQGDVGSGKTIVALIAHGAHRRGRRAGRAHGADGASRPPAFFHHRAARGGGRHRGRAPDRQGPGAGARRCGGADCRRESADRHRDACTVPGRRVLSPARPRGGRRAAPLRRAPAAGAVEQGRGAGRAGDDGHADPTHARALLFRRHGGVAAHREAGRPAADRHARRLARPARRSGGAHRPGDRGRRQGLLGVPAGRGVGEGRCGRGPGPFCSAEKSLRPPRRADPRAHERGREGRGDGGFSRRRSGDPRRPRP